MSQRIQRYPIIAVLVSVLIALSSGSFVVYSKISISNTHPLDVLYEKGSSQMNQAEPGILLKRLSLHLRGTIPTPAEVREWEEYDPSNRVAYFAIRFLKQAEFAEYWGIKFSSLFREHSKTRKVPTSTFYKFLSQSLHENKPYSQLVRELLLSSGNAKENPGVLFYLRDGADPLQVAEYVGRLFYAKRVACARCHDHPYISNFTRRDYYALAAFFSQQYFRDGSWEPNKFGPNIAYVPRELESHLPSEDQKILAEKNAEWNRNFWNQWKEEQRKEYQKKTELPHAELYLEPKLGLRFPHTDDSPGGDLVRPKFLDGTSPKLRPTDDRRKVFSDWLLDSKNDRFRKVMINRIWTSLMGWSFFTPLDDWNDDTKIIREDILNHLDAYFLANDYKIKNLIFYIVSSKAYQRESSKNGKEDATRYFPIKRLDANQLLNSLIRISDFQKLNSIRERKQIRNLVNLETANEDLKGLGELRSFQDETKEITNAVQVEQPAPYSSFLSIFGSGKRVDIADDSDELTIEQILTLWNGRVTGKLVSDLGGNGSYLKADFDKAPSMKLTIETLYKRVLGRTPTQLEWKKLESYLTKPDTVYDREVLQDVMWALINSLEFQHIQ